MATDKKIVEMVETLMKKLSANDSYVIAEICSIDPLRLKTHDVIIDQYIYANPIYINSPMPELKLKVGDNVIAIQDDVSFYIIERIERIV